MAYQMTVTLTDSEYAALSKEAAKSGKPIETLLHDMLAEHIGSATSKHSITRDEIQAFLYRQGLIEHLPLNEPDTPETEAERERLAHLFSQGKPASEMVIEDRGPR
ncbi:MAG TPA: hypothetical protein VKV20_07815 [Ktedonobacteraceae bacterium]|jgi:hypothetical protein|nr:hypothetical protein [Ktedonobacteraceae bacterium]